MRVKKGRGGRGGGGGRDIGEGGKIGKKKRRDEEATVLSGSEKKGEEKNWGGVE